MARWPKDHWGNESHNIDFETHSFTWGDHVETTCGKYRGLITHAYDTQVRISDPDEGGVWWTVKDIQLYVPDHEGR